MKVSISGSFWVYLFCFELILICVLRLFCYKSFLLYYVIRGRSPLMFFVNLI